MSSKEDLTVYIKQDCVECLNESTQHSCKHFMLNTLEKKHPPVNDNYYVESQTDEQLLIHIPFVCNVHIFGIKLFSDDTDHCPKTVKLFVNKPSLDFNDASSTVPTQVLEIDQAVAGDKNQKPIPLKPTKFRNVTNLTIFVEDNHGEETTKLKGIKLYGQSQGTTDMKNLKKTG